MRLSFISNKYFTLAGFDDLTRAYVKARSVIEKEEGGKPPTFYIRCLVELEDFIAEVSFKDFLFKLLKLLLYCENSFQNSSFVIVYYNKKISV